MALQIDRIDAEMEILRQPDSAPGRTPSAPDASGGEEALGALRGRSALREKLRPIVLEILHDELARMKRKVGSP
jgi:hypothetical protein